MGKIKKVLAKNILEPRTLTATLLWVDLCENVHIHYRNFRFDMSCEEFSEFMCAIKNLYKAVEYQMEQDKFEEGDPNYLRQIKYVNPLDNHSDYFPNRLVLEVQRDDTYHLHYRDLRIHLTEDEFDDMANAFIRAKEERDKFKAFYLKYGRIKEITRIKVNIDDVQPYDAGHLPLAECAMYDHTPGIEHCKKLIQEGKKILPILVRPDGQRLDGFKRYMAYKELGYKEIDVIVDPDGKMGGQHELPFVEENEQQ